MSEDIIGDKTCMTMCHDCKRYFHYLAMSGKWCEDCFESGLHKDMGEHFKNYVSEEIKQSQVDELSETRARLHEANERIACLEQELEDTKADAKRFRDMLDAAIKSMSIKA